MPVSYEDLMRNNQPQVGNGAGALIAALMGGSPAHRQQVQIQGYLTGQRMRLNDATISDRLANGRIHIAEAIMKEAQKTARTTYAQNFADAIAKHDIARAVTLANEAGYQPNETLLGLGAGYRGLADQDAYNAMLNGDVAKGNQMIAVAGNKPLEVARVEGGSVVNPHAPIAAQSFAPTAAGLAAIGRTNAGTAAQLALAAKRGATVNGVVSDGTGTYGRVQTPGGNTAIVDFDNSMPQAARDAAARAVMTGNPISDAMSSTSAPPGAPGRWSVQTGAADTQTAARPSFGDVRSDVSSNMTVTPPAAQSMLDRINTSLFGNGEPAAPASIDPADQVSGSDAVTVADKAAYDKLPPGTLWRDAAGNLRRKR